MAKKHAAEAPSYEVLKEVTVGTNIWKLQRSVFQDGESSCGIRRFIAKADGSHQVTTMGFSLKEDATFAATADAVIGLIQAAKKATSPLAQLRTGIEYCLMHKSGRAYGACDAKGVPVKGITKKFATVAEAKGYRDYEIPTKYQGDFKVQKYVK